MVDVDMFATVQHCMHQPTAATKHAGIPVLAAAPWSTNKLVRRNVALLHSSIVPGDIPSLHQLGFSHAALQRAKSDAAAMGAGLCGGERNALHQMHVGAVVRMGSDLQQHDHVCMDLSLHLKCCF